MMQTRRGRRNHTTTLSLLAGLALAAALTVYLLWVPQRPRKVAAPRATAASQETAETPERARTPVRIEPKLPPRGTVVRAELIGEVDVEKSVVCPGEDYKVTIDRAESDSDDEVVFIIEGAFGDTHVLREPNTENVRHHWIVATDLNLKRDFREITVQVLDAHDARCQTKPLVEVRQADDLSRPDGKRFEAVPLQGLGEIQSVEWSFGDGTSENAAGSRTSHSFVTRSQDTEVASFLITAFVTDVEGRHAYGRATVSFRNTYHQARRYSGNRSQPVEYDRFLFGGGSGLVPVRVTNIDSRSIEFRRAKITMNDCKGGTETVVEEVPAEELVQGLVGAGETKELVLELSGRWVQQGVCRLGVELVGDTIPPSTGTMPNQNTPPLRPVTASFQFEIDRPLSVAEGGAKEGASELVEDLDLQARILETMARLGSGHVTESDLARSEPIPE